MIRLSLRRALFSVLAAPLALGLAGCGGSGDGDSPSGDPIEKIAAPDGQSWNETVAKTEDGGYLMGNPDAPIKLIEYGSLTCPHCATFAKTSGEELHNEFVASGRVSFEFRNFVMNPLDLTMAILTRCGPPETFFALTDQVFSNQQSIVEKWSQAGEAEIMQAAEQPPESRYVAMAKVAGLTDFFAARGVSSDQAATCLADGAGAEAMVKQTAQQSEEFDITGTPAFILNGRKLDVNAWAEVKAQLETMGAR